MLNWTISDPYKGTSHNIVVDEDTVTIARVATLGGRPIRIQLLLTEDISFASAMSKIKNICSFDSEIFATISTHQATL